ncbi:MAG: hypothetical protein GXO34_03590 [Deltaproteobacteria bacterium]|nr:hypothetical protein [Deltaproteobacteria bacterium]
MCVEIKFKCVGGHQQAQFSNLNNILPASVINKVYCPECSEKPEFDAATMLEDNGWIIEYDMELAAYLLEKHGIDKELITPEFVFDNRYATWQGMSPTDMEESIRERQKIVELAKIDKKKYIETMKTWSIDRMNAFIDAGWRKAKAVQTV